MRSVVLILFLVLSLSLAEVFCQTPDMPTMSTNTCGPKTLTRGGGSNWYWVGTDPNNTSTDNGPTYTVPSSNGTKYYLRAKIGAVWAEAIGIAVHTDPFNIVLPEYTGTTVQASQSITLKPGFFVPAGKNFTANIGVTPGCAVDPAPTVNAGADVTLIWPSNQTTLTATATDPDTPLTRQWTKVSGPNTPNISSPTQLSTTVSIMVVGTYVFRLTVTDARGFSRSDDVTVSVSHPPIVPNNNFYNFVKTEAALEEGYTESSFTFAPLGSKQTVFQYFDGLSRVEQVVYQSNSPDVFADVVVVSEFDGFGRQTKEYLPYAAGGTNNGNFRTSAKIDQAAFYDPSGGEYKNKVKTDNSPYSVTVYDASPTPRALQKGSAGATWQPNTVTPDDGKAIKVNFLTNIDGSSFAGQESITRWEITPVTLNGVTEYLVSSTINYPSGSLYVRVIKDAENMMTREYFDKEGRLIVKKIQDVSSNPTTGSPRTFTDSDWTITYYTYDEAGRLRFVLQPKFILRNPIYNGLGTSQLKKNMLDSLSFEYRYDERGRVIYNRKPAASPVEFVYDRWNRLVLTQDGNQRTASTKKWTFVKYDSYNRTILAGELASNNDRVAMIAASNTVSVRNENTSSLNSVGYTLDLSFPTSTTVNDVNGAMYYDDYAFKTRLSLGTAYDASTAPGFTDIPDTELRNKPSGVKLRILDTNNWQVSVLYYDNLQRPMQIVRDDHLGKKITTRNRYYGLTRDVTLEKREHGNVVTTLVNKVNDATGRLLEVNHSIDNASTYVQVAGYRYNALGQMVEKNHHSLDYGATFLQSNDYRYSIRGWLTSINNFSLTNDGIKNDDANDLFGMEVKYEMSVAINGVNTSAKFDGNISSIQWQMKDLVNAPVAKTYGFKYDALDRLVEASYATRSGGSWDGDLSLFSETASYDKNGNIASLRRNALYNTTSTQLIDDLKYYYKGNRLDAISDNATSSNKPFGFSEIMQGITTGEYDYDKNGAMTIDQNKGIIGSGGDPAGIIYNYLGLPVEIRKGTAKVTYLYNAAGMKLRRIIFSGSTEVSRTDYVDELVYENNQPQFLLTSEGRAVKNGSSWEYEYFQKDHLGDVRMVYGYKKQVDSYLATMETQRATSEENQFKNVAGTRVNVFNRTPASLSIVVPVNSAETNGNIILSGTIPKSIGPAKMLQVNAGDRVQLEAFAKYNTNVGPNTTIITTLVSAVTSAYGVVNAGETATAFQAINGYLPGAAGAITRHSNIAKAYLCYMLFDNNHVPKQFGYQEITSAAALAPERLYLDVTMPNSGYLYTFVANESNVSLSTSVYFDDFKIVHTKSEALQVVQTSDYYPFGMPSSSWNRENSVENRFLSNAGSELNTLTGFSETFFRQYDPSTARFISSDPLSMMAESWSPYKFGYNNPVSWNDPSGALEDGDNPGFNEATWQFLMLLANDERAKDGGFWKDAGTISSQIGNETWFVATYSFRDHYGQPTTVGQQQISQASFLFIFSNPVGDENDLHSYSQLGRKVAGWTLSASIPFQEAFSRSNLYGKPAAWSETLITYEKSMFGTKVIHQPLFTMNSLTAGKIATGLKIASKVVGVVGGGLAAYDIHKNGLTTSNGLDLLMSTMAVTGVGKQVTGTYFLVNAGLVFFTGQDVGQYIDSGSRYLKNELLQGWGENE